ncbi:hypothetical protein GYA19_00610 [Candidatus Beckwithbacteria bacterium]|nr:hypothetical protein [Candidatus Beckwithbacteria bacterium]
MVENISETDLQELFEEGRNKRRELDAGRDPVNPITATFNIAVQATRNGVKFTPDVLKDMAEAARLRQMGLDEIEENN